MLLAHLSRSAATDMRREQPDNASGCIHGMHLKPQSCLAVLQADVPEMAKTGEGNDGRHHEPCSSVVNQSTNGNLCPAVLRANVPEVAEAAGEGKGGGSKV